jgi:hypothetical protein
MSIRGTLCCLAAPRYPAQSSRWMRWKRSLIGLIWRRDAQAPVENPSCDVPSRGPGLRALFVSSTLDGWLRRAGTLYMVAALVVVLWEIVARLQAAGRLKGAISFRRRRMADTVGVAAGSSEVPAVGDFDKPDKLEDRLVLLEYWKAVAAQRENRGAASAHGCTRSA